MATIPILFPGESQGQEPGGLPSRGSHRVRHNCRDLAGAISRPIGLECILLLGIEDRRYIHWVIMIWGCKWDPWKRKTYTLTCKTVIHVYNLCIHLYSWTSIYRYTENTYIFTYIRAMFVTFLKTNIHRLYAAAAKSLQSCPTLCDPIDGSPLGSPVPGILQARTLEWVAISFSNAWKWKVKVKLLSYISILCNKMINIYSYLIKCM